MTGLDKEAIGRRIAELRDARGWSQGELAERLHVSRQTVSNWERGKTLVDVQSLAAMAAEAGCPLSELLGEEQMRAARQGTEVARRELKIIYAQRRSHRLPEWREFCAWVESLPMAKELILPVDEEV